MRESNVGLYQSLPDLARPKHGKLGTAIAATGIGTGNISGSTFSSHSLATLPMPVLAGIFQYVQRPRALASSCRTLHNLARDEQVCARWILARAGVSLTTPRAVAPARIFAIVKAGLTARVLSMNMLAVLDRWVGHLKTIDVFRTTDTAAARDWDGWQEMDIAIARCGDAKVVAWCAERGFVTSWDRAIEVAVGAGEMDSAVTLLAKWTEAAAASREFEDAADTEDARQNTPASPLKRANSQTTIVPGASTKVPMPIPPTPYRSQPANRAFPSLAQPLPASTLPALLHSPRILACAMNAGLLTLDSLLLTLAKSPAATRALALRNLTMHSNAIEGNIARSCAAGLLLARAALEGDAETCEWLVQAGVPVSDKAMRNAKEAGEKAVLKVLKKSRK
ncbi:hypothetical protein HDU86_004000 [Geranomyces michiganensis]|nr:hypothetical protein HDU86_004000 [Geranomyces michiganensis]